MDVHLELKRIYLILDRLEDISPETYVPGHQVRDEASQLRALVGEVERVLGLSDNDDTEFIGTE